MAEAANVTRLPSVLFQSEDSSVVLVDVPRSIEEAQFLSSKLTSTKCNPKRIVSAKPPDKPFKTPEPRDAAAVSPESVSSLFLCGAAANALDVLTESYSGPWLLPRVVPGQDSDRDEDHKRKRPAPITEPALDTVEKAVAGSTSSTTIPEGSNFLHGTISAERQRFIGEAPVFNLIVLDPPWPNRSARRKSRNYKVADSLDDIRATLSSIPVAAHLAPDGLVAIWMTNKPSIEDLMTGPRGLLNKWGLEIVGEWLWLKVTTSGEPIVDVNSQWRKPWERILIARRRGSSQRLACRSRVVVSVPDVHSRKPNLRGLFEAEFSPDYKGLEIFARNLTAGWWAWGDEVLKFQRSGHWVDPSSR